MIGIGHPVFMTLSSHISTAFFRVRAIWNMEIPMMRPILTLALLLLLSAPALALAKVPLRDEAHINAQLLAAQIGDILRKTCPQASARMFVVLGKMNDLESYARKQGYTDAEVKAFLKDKTEKARIRGLAEDYLAQAGAIKGDAESYCRVARDEVARGTLTGQLLRVAR